MFEDIKNFLAFIKSFREELRTVRPLIDEADDSIDALTANGIALPPSLVPVVKILDILRKVVDVIDGAAGVAETNVATAHAEASNEKEKTA